ncbi:TIGR03085 family protein [Ruania alkalisoli]|uniref:TIGR03085 family protein n=1 Tax=Ruania alkalisoli TaxID=2779775 RepID=A0A7M1SXK4_9MICO|nr:TIGR03085 family metal-binding protein [Ruania alkalisoli]QOR72316.1 TIGR03085 family protein [Ruania alkalisoli]
MWAQREQHALLETMRAAGPDAPTLCEGWQTRHLAAHLYLRGHRPWALLRGADAAIDELSTTLTEPHSYEDLLAEFSGSGPGMSGLVSLPLLGDRADETANHLEYLVHHEDVRRAGERPTDPRALPAEQELAIWNATVAMARLAYRSAPTGVVLVWPGGPRAQVRKDSDSVALVGEPVEQALYAFGRRDHADLTLRGAPDAVARMRDWAA